MSTFDNHDQDHDEAPAPMLPKPDPTIINWGTRDMPTQGSMVRRPFIRPEPTSPPPEGE